MSSLRRIARLPDNFDEFVDEVAQGLGGLYGPAAEARYRESAAKDVRAALRHPATDAVAFLHGDRVVGMLMAVLRDRVCEISFTHVLKGHAGRGVEKRMIAESVNTFRAGGADGILSECITFCPLEEEEVYAELGFAKVDRAIMGAELGGLAFHSDEPAASRPLGLRDGPEAAEIIVEAYEGHPGRSLHNEVRTPSAALAFINSVTSGGYGEVRDAYVRVLHCKGDPAGVIVGCEVAPDVGFVLQVAVRPACQGRGLGSRLVRELAGVFAEAGLDRMALGVTWDNPARRLYERLGFASWRRLNAYVWWRP